MSQTFSCPKCAAPLDYDGGNDFTIRCPFCDNSVIVPEELRGPADVPSGHAKELGEIAFLARSGNKIEAIKLYRATFGGGLKEAKDAVEGIAANKNIVATLTRTEPVSGKALVSIGALSMAPVIAIFVIACLAIGLGIFAAFAPVQVANLIGLESTATPTRAVATRTPVPTPTPPPTPTPSIATVALKFGGEGTGAGLFTDARSLSVDGAGNIYVGEYKGARVQVFDASGKFITQWNAGDSNTRLQSLAADRKGTVYAVVDGKIARYEGASGKPLGALSYPDGDGFYNITIAADGGLIGMWSEGREGLITSIKGHRDDLVRFTPDGQVAKVIRGVISEQTGSAELNNYVAIDGLGNLYIIGGVFEPAVFKFTPEGKYVNKFGTKGNGPGQFNSPRAIAVDNQSRVYVADVRGIQVFDGNGRYLATFTVDGSATEMTINDKNELFVLARSQVMRFGLK